MSRRGHSTVVASIIASTSSDGHSNGKWAVSSRRSGIRGGSSSSGCSSVDGGCSGIGIGSVGSSSNSSVDCRLVDSRDLGSVVACVLVVAGVLVVACLCNSIGVSVAVSVSVSVSSTSSSASDGLFTHLTIISLSLLLTSARSLQRPTASISSAAASSTSNPFVKIHPSGSSVSSHVFPFPVGSPI